MPRTQPPLNRFLTYGLALAAAVGLVLGLASCTQPSGDGGVRPSAGASPAESAATKPKLAKPKVAKPRVASKPRRTRTASRTVAKPKAAATAKATPAPAVRSVSYPSMTTPDDRGQ